MIPCWADINSSQDLNIQKIFRYISLLHLEISEVERVGESLESRKTSVMHA